MQQTNQPNRPPLATETKNATPSSSPKLPVASFIRNCGNLFSPATSSAVKVSQFIQEMCKRLSSCCCSWCGLLLFKKDTGFWWHCSICVYTAFLLMDLGCDLRFELWLGSREFVVLWKDFVLWWWLSEFVVFETVLNYVKLCGTALKICYDFLWQNWEFCQGDDLGFVFFGCYLKMRKYGFKSELWNVVVLDKHWMLDNYKCHSS